MTQLVTYGSVGGVGSDPGPYPAGNAGIASRLTIEHAWPGLGEPGRWTSSITMIRMIAKKLAVVLVISAYGSLSVQTRVWQPSPGHMQLRIWPGGAARCETSPGTGRRQAEHRSVWREAGDDSHQFIIVSVHVPLRRLCVIVREGMTATRHGTTIVVGPMP